MPRISKKIPLRQKIFIFCEGSTEKNYFEQLRQTKNISNATVVKLLKGEGDYVDKAERQIKHLSNNINIKEKVLVFDSNHQSNKILQQLIKKAQSKNYTVAFSNTCFEVWLLSHFELMTSSIVNEKELCKKLTTHLTTKYKKSDTNQIAKIANKISDAYINASSINQIDLNWQSTNVGDVISNILL